VIVIAKLYLVQDKSINASRQLHQKCTDKKSDGQELGCDGSLDFQSASPSDYQHKVTHAIRTTERGMSCNRYQRHFSSS